MGLALKEASKAKKNKVAREPKSKTKRKMKEQSDAKELLKDDPEVIAGQGGAAPIDGSASIENSPASAKIIPAFEEGIVHNALRDAVNVHWRKSAEVDILGSVITNVLRVNGVFVGSLYAKPSFAHREGGKWLL